jgi:hypothetical protein
MLFVSHKHADRKLAEVLGQFIEERSTAKIKVYLSSSPDFQGPRFGPGLNSQLRQALWKTEVLVLLYTSEDQDWSYCMWECGIATHPDSPNTNLIVFQCSSDVPGPFQDVLRVNPGKLDDIKRFVDQILRDKTLFHAGAIAPDLKDVHIENLATELHNRLAAVLPPLEDGQVERWPAWPYLRIEIPRSEADKIEKASEPDRLDLSRQIVRDQATVVRNDPRAAQLFGKLSFPGQIRFRELLQAWKDKYPEDDSSWFDSCCQQIMVAVRRGFPVIPSTSMRETGGDSSFTPVVTGVQRLPFSGTVQFDVFFFNLSDPRAVLVTTRMIPIADVFCKRMGEIDPNTLRLTELINELTTKTRNRVPILTSSGAPLYIVHRSMIEKFIVKTIMQTKAGKDPSAFTLADLLKDPEMKATFESTFVVVTPQSSLAQAKAAMVAREGCNDVFVTKTGALEEPVLGLLTNVIITQNI